MLRRGVALHFTVAALLALNLVATRWLPSLRWIVWAFFAGCAAMAVALLSVVFLVPGSSADDNEALSKLQPLAFVHPRAWDVETEASSLEDTYLPAPLYPPSFVISEALDVLLQNIIRDFVLSWYSHVSTDRAFVLQVEKLIRYVLGRLLRRVQDLDLVELFVGKIVPLLTTHLTDFAAAEQAVCGKRLENDLTPSDELDLAVAAKYRNGKLHPAACLAFADMKLAQQEHLRAATSRALAALLPEKEQKSRVLGILVREIVSSAILYPVMTMLSDPDFWNQLVEALGRSTLQDRKTVRKLRAALDQHAAAAAPQVPKARPTRTIQRTQFIRLGPEDDERTFERFIRAIRHCNNLSDARRFRSEITAQLKRDAKAQDPSDGWTIYLKRLETGKRQVDQRVAYLSSEAASTASPIYPDARSPTPASHTEPNNLEQVLRDSAGLSYFMEHMDRKRRLALVQFWLVVEGLRTPLEDDVSSDEDNISPFPAWTQSDRNDLAQIHDAYLANPQLRIADKAKESVKEFLKAGNGATRQQYARARSAILKAQSNTYHDMQERDFAEFKVTDLYYKYLASDDAHGGQSSRSSLEMKSNPSWPSSHSPELWQAFDSDDTAVRDRESDPISQSRQSLEDEETPRRAEPVFQAAERTPQRAIVEAMEAALNDIIEQQPAASTHRTHNSPPMAIIDTSDSPRSSIDAPNNEDDRTREVIQEDGKKKPPSIASLGLVRMSRGSVFDDDELFPSDDIPELSPVAEDKKSMPEKQSSESDDEEVHQAAPGDLGLAEAISALSRDIEKLFTQEAVIDSLYRKAELTNNVVELRILKKSKESLQREIRRKELQRQQYIVQESDNSLFGRATVRITSTMVGSENGQEYALYIVQIQRGRGEQLPAVQWIVARRYSEFFQLHQQLKRFHSVRQLEFPRRRMVMKLQRDFLEKRRMALEKYLKSLILLPEVCRSIEFRAFLSEQSIEPTKSTQTPSDDRRDIMTRLYNSIADGMEDVLGSLPILDQLSVASANIIAAATGQPQLPAPPNGIDLAPNAIQEAEAELSAFEDRELEPFVKPICDLFLEVFELNRRSNWFRGRAVVVVLHQLLGGTIERKIREQAKMFLDEESILNYIQRLQDHIWPSGALRQPSPARSLKDRDRARKEAKVTLATLIPDMSQSVVGRGNAQAAGRKLFAAFNNKRLNASITYTIFDEIVSAVLDSHENQR